MGTSTGGFCDYLTSLRVIDDQDIRDGDEEETAICVEGATVDDVGVGRFRFGLSDG